MKRVLQLGILLLFCAYALPLQAVETETKIIPLPIYATLPNEGSTFGVMPVFLVVEKDTQRTQSIFAPSESWNQIINFTTTFRWFYYPSDHQMLTLIPSVSTTVNRGITVEYSDVKRSDGETTLDASLHMRRSIFYRFFGIGPDSNSNNESSYTRVGGDTSVRYGYNVTPNINIGAKAGMQRDLVERLNVNFLPLTNNQFPGTAGLGGSTTLSQGLSLRYDTRPYWENSRKGTAAELYGGFGEGLSGAGIFGRVEGEARTLWDESDWIYGAARAFWGYTPGSNIPFYAQETLGGSFRLRGFTEDRFIDKGAWEVEIEQRITLFQTHIYGVTADWRIDPFLALGQVYEDLSQVFAKPRPAVGLGFRAFVRPNVLGRVDVAYSVDGIKTYVELGYPF